MSENITARFLDAGQFSHPAAGVTLYIREISPEGELLDMFLADERSQTRRTVYTAGRALFLRGDQGPQLLMFGGMAQVLNRADGTLSVTRFARFTYDLGALLTGAVTGRRTIDTLPTRELLMPTDAVAKEAGKTREALMFAGHTRLGEPFLALAAALIGFAALLQGSYSRTGLWWQIGLAVGLLVVVQGVTTLAAARGARLPMGWLLAYAAPVLGLSLATGMLWWASRPRRRPRDVAAEGGPA
jgi:lipopolysaccharide export system permease protein